jgi:Ca2+-binding RTX toxin-like protein
VTYRAASGEVNDVRVVAAGGVFRITDPGAVIAAGVGCDAVSLHEVTCKPAGAKRAVVDLGDGADSVVLGPAVVLGLVHAGDGNDVLRGGDRRDRLYGDAGDDVLRGGKAIHVSRREQIVDGGPGDDDVSGQGLLVGGKGADKLHAGSGRTLVDYSASMLPVVVSLDGKPGDGAAGENDTIGFGVDGVIGGSGDDTLLGNSHLNELFGGPGDDVLRGRGKLSDVVVGNAGDDTIFGGPSEDDLSGGSGNDNIQGGASRDFIDGGPGADNVQGGAGRDLIFGGPGADWLRAGGGSDIVGGQAGSDTITGGRGSDVIEGEAGSDTITGGPGRDDLRGGSGNDIFYAGDGVEDGVFGYLGIDRAHIDSGLDRVHGVERRL